ncbi:MAG: AbrB/MazE/SpoVT family DNA-binding domain-containing protein [Bacteroidia bacterium]
MRTSIKRIGNSKGIIIPAGILKLCGFEEEVSLEIKGNTLVISNAKTPRAGWEEAFAKAGAGQEGLLMEEFPNDFDKNEWTW